MADGQNVTDLRPLMEDLLRLGMQEVPGFTNRAVDRIQLEYVTNPYGRQPPHVLVFPDGRVERMTPFQTPVPGYAGNVLAVELLGVPGHAPSSAQLNAVRQLGAQVRQFIPGKLGFSGHEGLVSTATRESGSGPEFMDNAQLRMADIVPTPPVSQLSNVQEFFDILGTPQDRRRPLAPGSLFNSVGGKAGLESASALAEFKAPATRIVVGLVIVPSHDAMQPEPTDASAYSLQALKQNDQRLGMPDFRGHFLIARDGTMIPGRDLEALGNCWPGRNEGTVQVVVAGNGSNPTPDQRRTIYQYGVFLRRHLEYPLQAFVRDVKFADQLLGIGPNNKMVGEKANAALIDADSSAPQRQAG